MTVPTVLIKPLIIIDGDISDWVPSERIDYGDVLGFSLYAQTQGDFFYFALSGSVAIGPNTTFWFNTDQNSATGFQIFGFAGGTEFNVNIKSDGTAALYSDGAGQTLILGQHPDCLLADHRDGRIRRAEDGVRQSRGHQYAVRCQRHVFGPTNYSAQPYIAFNETATPVQTRRTGSASCFPDNGGQYFSATAYSQLFMTIESQAMQAGISFDILHESDLTDISKLANYDALVFHPSLMCSPARSTPSPTRSCMRRRNSASA